MPSIAPKHVLLALPLSSLAAGAASAQVARCLLQEGAPLPAAGAGHTVTSISNTAVNQVGGFAATINTSDGFTTLSHVWGNASGGAGAILRTESTVGTLEQTSFESFFGISDAGNVAYSPSSVDTVTMVSGLDGVWLDDTVVALEDEPIPSLPGSVWRFASRPGVTANGQPYWVGGINDAATGASEGNGLFFGLSATVLYQTDDVIAPLPDPLGPGAIDFDVRFSAQGSHHILAIDTTGSSSNDAFLVVDGAVLTVAGNLVGEGEPIDASAGGMPGETWQNFDFLGITESGETLFTGDTGAFTNADEFLAKNGTILYREGGSLDGFTLTGSIEGAYMNEAGDFAFIWDVEESGGGSVEALFLGNKLLLKEGDAVDFDGDGSIDAGATISGFTGLTALTLGPNRVAYFTADVDTMGTVSTADDTECFFALEAPSLSVDAASLSLSAGGTAAFELCGGLENASRPYLVLGSVSGTSPGIVVDGVLLPLNIDAYFLVTLTAPNSSVHVGTFGVLSATGSGSASLVVPTGTDPGLAGLTLTHAFATLELPFGAVAFASNPVDTILAP